VTKKKVVGVFVRFSCRRFNGSTNKRKLPNNARPSNEQLSMPNQSTGEAGRKFARVIRYTVTKKKVKREERVGQRSNQLLIRWFHTTVLHVPAQPFSS
jgi:hypothetical protein